MKYIFTHYPSFQKKAMPITIVGVGATLLFYSLHLFILGAGTALLTLGMILKIQKSCQLKVVVNGKGISFQVGPHKTAYSWRCVQRVQSFDKGVQILLKAKTPIPVAIPSTGEGSRQYSMLVKTLKEICRTYQIECFIK